MNKYQIAYWLRDHCLINVGKNFLGTNIYVCKLCLEQFLFSEKDNHFYEQHAELFDFKWTKNKNKNHFLYREKFKEKRQYNKLSADNNPEQEFSKILENNKLYEKESRLFLCPKCHHYSVNYYSKDNSWQCNLCFETIKYSKYNFDLKDDDKYNVYKICGIDGLSILTKESIEKVKEFVASYFRKCCLTKKDKCLYFDYFQLESN